MGASRQRRAGAAALVVVVALAGVVGLLAFFNSRDDATFAGDQATGPGELVADQGARHLERGESPDGAYASDPPTSGPHVPEPVRRDETQLSDDQLIHALELGNVVLVYPGTTAPREFRALAREVAGAFDADLARAGQAVILARRPQADGEPVALAWRRLLRPATPGDPAVRQFVERWLGRGDR